MANSQPHKYVPEGISLHSSRKGKCVVCGKVTTNTRRFTEVPGPLNKGADGMPYSRAQLYKRVDAAAKAWQSEPMVHTKCRDEYDRQHQED